MKRTLLIITILILSIGAIASASAEEKRWAGVDEAVVEKFAKELGREARDPYFNTDQGDLLLFFFTLAGAIGGFVIGYHWHKVFVAGRVELEDSMAKEDSGGDA